ncbi:MAG TPA: hypothetical protein VMT20_15170 [Terriglobia bacterium]|nr:hypothetical protein [Terriglobia bacterium]
MAERFYTFAGAICLLREGKKIRFSSWPPGDHIDVTPKPEREWYIFEPNSTILYHSPEAVPSEWAVDPKELLLNNWQEYEE